MRTVVAAVVVFVVGLAAGCGDDDGEPVDVGGGATTASTTARTTTELEIVVNDGSSTREATLRCGDGEAEGTGYLAEPAAAEAACGLLASDEGVRRRLVEGEPEGRLCTEIYGGPEEATVTGTLDGSPVRTSVDRADGCGIADWDRLGPLLGPPG